MEFLQILAGILFEAILTYLRMFHYFRCYFMNFRRCKQNGRSEDGSSRCWECLRIVAGFLRTESGSLVRWKWAAVGRMVPGSIGSVAGSESSRRMRGAGFLFRRIAAGSIGSFHPKAGMGPGWNDSALCREKWDNLNVMRSMRGWIIQDRSRIVWASFGRCLIGCRAMDGGSVIEDRAKVIW